MMKGFWVLIVSAVFSVVVSTGASAEDAGIPLAITVIDATTEAPIKSAVVRHPDEQNRHQVNTATGTTEMSVLYMDDGTEVIFTKGMQLSFEISAPGYLNQKVTYIMRKRKNRITVRLSKMEMDMDMEDEDDPVIQFGRDRPLDGQEIPAK
jgi:hypothetical protein